MAPLSRGHQLAGYQVLGSPAQVRTLLATGKACRSMHKITVAMAEWLRRYLAISARVFPSLRKVASFLMPAPACCCFARPTVPRYLRRCTVCATQAHVQLSFLRQLFHLKKSVTPAVIFRELAERPCISGRCSRMLMVPCSRSCDTKTRKPFVIVISFHFLWNWGSGQPWFHEQVSKAP